MNTQVTGQQTPGKSNKYLRPSYVAAALAIIAYLAVGAYGYYRANKEYQASLPDPWLNSWITDLRAFYMKARPARFPRDLVELDNEVWKSSRNQGQPVPVFEDGNLSTAYAGYKYLYSPVPGRPDLCTVFAVPLGPRRFEPGVKTFFLIISPTGMSRWEGRALSD